MSDDIQPPVSDRPRRAVPPQPTRGRPADPDMVVVDEGIEFLDSDTGKPLTRRSRRDGAGNPYDVPIRLRRSGWDYEWKGDLVMNQPVAASEKVSIHEAGWRPVPAKDMMELCPPGWDKTYVQRDGMTLMMRPMHLTAEAREEDRVLAEQVKAARLDAGAVAANISRDSRMPAQVSERRIEGEMGHHRQPGRDERAASR